MTAITENDLKRLEDLINSRFDALNERIQGVEIKLAIVITKVEGVEKRFDDNNKRIDELSARMNTMMIGFLSILGIFATGILGIIGKIVFFPSS